MADNDDYMTAKSTGNTITENMWDRLQEGINANRRYRLKAVAGGNSMRYSSTKVVWDTDIYIFFTRESDGVWVYNKINANPTTGITCDSDDLLYVTLSDTSTTVLTISSADYTSMPTDDTGRILILGAVSNSTWYGNVIGGVGEHDNTFHSTDYAAATDLSDHASDTSTHNVAQVANHAEIASQILTHKNLAGDHHTKYALLDDLIANEITVIKAIDDASINNTKWDYIAALTENPQTHMTAGNPHSSSASNGDLSSHAGDDNAHHEVFEHLHDDLTPQLASTQNLDLNKGKIFYNGTVLTDGTCAGLIVSMHNGSGSTRYFGDFVYIKGVSGGYGSFGLTNAGSANTMPCVGMVVSTVANGNIGRVLLHGIVYSTGFPALAPSSTGIDNVIYMSLNSGDITKLAPSSSSAIVQAVGVAIHNDKIIFNPSFTTVEVVA